MVVHGLLAALHVMHKESVLKVHKEWSYKNKCIDSLSMSKSLVPNQGHGLKAIKAG